MSAHAYVQEKISRLQSQFYQNGTQIYQENYSAKKLSLTNTESVDVLFFSLMSNRYLSSEGQKLNLESKSEVEYCNCTSELTPKLNPKPTFYSKYTDVVPSRSYFTQESSNLYNSNPRFFYSVAFPVFL